MQFTDQQIQRAREVPIQRIVGVDSNGRTKIQCPIHYDETPSFLIDEENGYHCFGCGAHGNNAIDFCMDLDDVSFEKAVEFLISNYN